MEKSKIETTPIIADGLNRSRYTFDMPRIPLAVAQVFLIMRLKGEIISSVFFEDRDGFMSRMEGLLGRQLKDLSPGRFRKNQ